MSFVYREEERTDTEKGGFNVGHYAPDGTFISESWFPYKSQWISGKPEIFSYGEAKQAAQDRCHYLNGGG